MTDLTDLPTGTVTLLFTDLEGSTRLLEAHPAAYRQAVARHHDLLRAAVEGHGGAVFETVGDAVYAAFAHAPGRAPGAVCLGERALGVPETGGAVARVGGLAGQAGRGGGGAGRAMGSGGAAPEPFGAHRRRRRAAGLTQEGLAERAGLSARRVSALERGARRASQRETVRRLVRALRLRPARAASRAMSPEQALADALEEHGVG